MREDFFRATMKIRESLWDEVKKYDKIYSSDFKPRY